MTPVKYHEAAEEELLHEIGYLQLRANGLGRRFFAEVQRTEKMISQFPESEAQNIWQHYRGESSAFVPGTPAYEYAQRRMMVYMTEDRAELINRLTIEYGKLLGFTQ